MKRPLRSVMLANPRYLSAYVLGVGQAMGARGDWHRLVSLFDDRDSIARQIAEMAPDVIWTHCAAWPPPGACGMSDPNAAAIALAEILGVWKRRGAIVLLHDGDPRRHATAPDLDVEAAFTVALVNRAVDDQPWPIECRRWLYAAFPQREIAPPREEWRCDLLFAGHLRRADEGYGDRTRLVYSLARRLGSRMRIVSPGGGDVNNRMLAADVAPSCAAVLGYGRPDVRGWVDTRVFQYPGAGGVLIHDDAGDVLTPDEHYLRFDPRDAEESILRLLYEAKDADAAWKLRVRAFEHVQRHHTWRNRVDEALAPFFGSAS